ncbi:MAG: hypothetical protein AAFR51_06600 [Pseudomonadota bacterium]
MKKPFRLSINIGRIEFGLQEQILRGADDMISLLSVRERKDQVRFRNAFIPACAGMRDRRVTKNRFDGGMRY